MIPIILGNAVYYLSLSWQFTLYFSLLRDLRNPLVKKLCYSVLLRFSPTYFTIFLRNRSILVLQVQWTQTVTLHNLQIYLIWDTGFNIFPVNWRIIQECEFLLSPFKISHRMKERVHKCFPNSAVSFALFLHIVFQ